MFKRLKNFTVTKILINSVKDFLQSESVNLAAGTAFYTIFSLPALLIIIMNIGATFYEESEFKDELLIQVEELIGDEGRETLENILENVSMASDDGISYYIAIGILLFSATTIFVSLQNAINLIWHIRAKPKRGWLKFAINRLLSFSVVASIGFMMLVFLVLDAALVVISNYFSQYLEDVAVFAASIAHIVISHGLLVLIFALMYKVLPDANVPWRDTWLGAVVTMVLFALGKYLIGLYMGQSDLGSTYGAAGSLVILLIWVYYSVIIFLFGSQVTYYIAKNTKGDIIPKKQAVRFEWREIEEDSPDN